MKHIAFIMDGNRRWATSHMLPKIVGHTEGAKTLKKIAKAVKNHDIPYMTVYALSTENLKRSQKELDHLFSLFSKLIDQLNDLIADDVRVHIIGNLDLLPDHVRRSLQDVMQQTKSHKSMTLTLAIAYGGRDEIVRAIKKLPDTDISEEQFSDYLDTADIPEPDIIIRTGGQHRLSNFLLWQGSYAELYFTDTYWPALDESELDDILTWYDAQQKNNGK